MKKNRHHRLGSRLQVDETIQRWAGKSRKMRMAPNQSSVGSQATAKLAQRTQRSKDRKEYKGILCASASLRE
jgi:hypothetical protein